MGIGTGLAGRAANKTVPTLRDKGLLKGFSDHEASKEVTQMVKDGTLIAGFEFDGAGGSPIIRKANRTPMSGLYFPGGVKPVFDPF
jgi:hypothetical protein